MIARAATRALQPSHRGHHSIYSELLSRYSGDRRLAPSSLLVLRNLATARVATMRYPLLRRTSILPTPGASLELRVKLDCRSVSAERPDRGFGLLRPRLEALVDGEVAGFYLASLTGGEM
jgi:hypothetical protein